MRCSLLLGLIVLTFAAALQGQQPAALAPSPPLLLRPARVYDGVSDRSQEGVVVLVQGDKILAYGAIGDVSVPKDARIIDLPGLTLLPGLMDAHSHVALVR